MNYKSGEEIKVGDLVQGLPRDSAHPVMGTVLGFEKVGNDLLAVVAYAAMTTKKNQHHGFKVGTELVSIMVQKAYFDEDGVEFVWRN